MTTITIGPLAYDLEIVEDLKTDEGVGLFGQILYTEQVIKLEKEMTPERAFTALWHEVLHGAADLYRLPFEDSEQTIGTLAMIITQLLKDNPELRYNAEKA